MVTIQNGNTKQKSSICGRISQMKLKEEELEAFKEYSAGGKLIQEYLPNLNRCEREFLKSGFCPNCQLTLFGNNETKRIN